MSTELIFGERIARTAPIRLTVTGAIPDAEGRLLLVRRADNGRWCLPGGGVDSGERVVEALVREVEEETGLACELHRELGSICYTDARGREKTVRYWAMSSPNREAEPGDGVDEIRWLPPTEAAALLTHERDREILAAFAPGEAAA